MRRIVTMAAALLACVFASASAPSYTIKLLNGLNARVEVCTDEIIRISYSPREAFAESLMERYGIVKSDWDGNAFHGIAEDASSWTLTTKSRVITMDKKDGTIKVADLGGKSIVNGIRMVTAKDPLCSAMADNINKAYADLHVASNGGIIGDDDGQFSEKDKAESGDPDKSSIISIALKEDDRIYGGGSTSREHIQHRGELLRMWTTYQHTEIPMPFMMSSNGWGIFNNTTRKNFFDVGKYDKDRLNIYNTCDEADFYLFLGGTMPEILNEYTLTTGRTYVLPKWAYGLCFGPNMKENQWDILNDAVHFRQAEVPCDLFWLEPQWMAKRYDFSTEKKFNADLFSVEPYWLANKEEKQLYPRLFIGKLGSMGFHLGLWICEEYDPSITEEDSIALREGRDTSGQVHWMDHLSKFLDYGVSGFKIDPARTIDEHTFWKYYNGRTDKEMHNLNQVLMPKQCNEMARNHTGKRIWEHYCGGWSGTQHWTASTSGDNGGGKTALFDQLNLGMSGFMNTSCDVMSVDRDLEMQSLHFGLFLPWVQINSWFSMMHPFYYGEEEQTIYRELVKYRYKIIPYTYSTALEGAQDGMPIVRSMPLSFPEDRNCDDMTYQYMFGQNYLVGIFTKDVYLPAGTWTDAWTGERIYSKGETVTRDYPKDRAGLLFIREGAIIPCMKEDVQYLGTKPVSDYTIRAYPGGESSFTMYEDDGDSYEFEKGAIASTLFESKVSGGETTLTINPVQGSFIGMPQTRSYGLEVYMDKPSKVLVNGSKTKDWSYTDGKVVLDLGSVSIDDKITVTLR